jgi:hypothetical protein
MAESARILHNAENIDRLSKKAKKTKKRRKASAHKEKPAPPTDHSKHYRLNLAEIPFVAGKVRRTIIHNPSTCLLGFMDVVYPLYSISL